jgi:hypothetical protein
VVAFAQAIIVARNGHSLSTLARAHGLTDVTSLDASVEELALRVENNGTFQEFNDAIAPLGRIWYFDSSMPKWHERPFDVAAGLSGQKITITDILARAPGIADRCAQTFGSSAKTTPIMLDFPAPYTGSCTLRIDDPVLFTDRASLVASIQDYASPIHSLSDGALVKPCTHEEIPSLFSTTPISKDTTTWRARI